MSNQFSSLCCTPFVIVLVDDISDSIKVAAKFIGSYSYVPCFDNREVVIVAEVVILFPTK